MEEKKKTTNVTIITQLRTLLLAIKLKGAERKKNSREYMPMYVK